MAAYDSLHRLEALSLGEVNSRGACTPGHQLLPHILKSQGSTCSLLSWASELLS